MAAAFPFDQLTLPHLPTRKALLVLDLQNDFLAPDGALPVTSPGECVERVVRVAEAFRLSPGSDVIWVRSQFEKHRSTGNEQIVTTDKPLPSSFRSSTSSRGRRRGPEAPVEPPDADAEAFLSLAGDLASEAGSSSEKPKCVRAGTTGSELAADVAAAVDPARDLVVTKTHYSAFESSQLLMRLRARFATQLYICGALTNISIYATALDAGRHGLAVTIIDDCCVYRSEIRHSNAVRKLADLIGAEAMLADDVIAAVSSKGSTNGKRRGENS